MREDTFGIQLDPSDVGVATETGARRLECHEVGAFLPVSVSILVSTLVERGTPGAFLQE